jgi:hypothetical protein
MSSKRFDLVVVGNVGVKTNIYSASGDIDFGVESNFTNGQECPATFSSLEYPRGC